MSFVPTCAFCQAEVGPQAKFCTTCGKPVTARTTMPSPPPPVAAPPAPRVAVPKPPVATAASSSTWTAVFEEPPRPTQRVNVEKALRVGRESTCDVVLAGIGISREHVRLEPTPDGVLLIDLGSTNGTFVNGVPVKGSAVLREGDTAIIGDTKVRVNRG